MHESSIAYNLVHNALEIAAENGLTRVTRIHLSIGRMHHIVPKVLQRHFRLMAKKFPAVAGAKLLVNMDNIRVRCKQCNRETEMIETFFQCPHCHSIELEMIAGTDMHIIDIRGEKSD